MPAGNNSTSRLDGLEDTIKDSLRGPPLLLERRPLPGSTWKQADHLNARAVGRRLRRFGFVLPVRPRNLCWSYQRREGEQRVRCLATSRRCARIRAQGRKLAAGSRTASAPTSILARLHQAGYRTHR